MRFLTKTTLNVEQIPINSENLAAAFWEMDNFEQAEFFNELARLIKNDSTRLYKLNDFQIQIVEIIKSNCLTKDGLDLLKVIAYACIDQIADL